MESVGVRELKMHLSRYLKKVREGRSLVITDRKKEVAILMPRDAEPQDEKFLDLVRKGSAQWSGGRPKGMAKRVMAKGPRISEAVLEDRR